MTIRKSFVPTLWVILALALLASVLGPSSRATAAATATRIASLRRDFTLPPTQPTTRFKAATDPDSVVPVDDFSSDENEEQDWADALDEPLVSLLSPYSCRKVPDRQLISPHSILSLYPLRC